ncbi:MAG: diadenylate cyclase CdaA [Clostridia bacterium]|nr:diadenylate cyclase CdaA [Clostridia bacterium]
MDLSVKFFDFLTNIKNAFDLSSPLRVVMLILDVAIVAVVVYYIYVLIKKTRAVQIFKGFLIILALLAVSELLDLVILNFILENFLTYGMILMIIVFQPELRSALEKLGRKNFANIFDFDDKIRDKQVISEIVKAVEIMSLKKIGAIIVIEQSTKINDIIREGVDLSAKVSSELIQTIFNPRTPLHDGAVIIENNQIKAAKCVLPLASENMVPRNVGTRHRAAIGMSEVSDALVIVVSEETGIISFVEDGKMKRDLNGDKLSSLLLRSLDNNRERVNISKAKDKLEEKIDKKA